MKNWDTFLRDSLITGAIATSATTVAIALCGTVEQRNPVAPVNAVSHIIWGKKAGRKDHLSWKFTGTGLALNTLAVGAWGAIFEALFGERTERHALLGLVGGLLVSLGAYFVDYFVVPQRLTPGFELRLRRSSLFWIYVVLALSFPFRAVLSSRD